MQLPEGHRLAYVIGYEAWYFQHQGVTARRQLDVTASAQDGVAWHFVVEEVNLGRPTSSIRLAVYEDAFVAFQQLPEFFAAVGEGQPKTLPEVVAILDAMGAVDETERQRPATL
ncbi:hypothetical protein AB0J43_00240 [Nonomuraea fuscirosea]